ncbi:MAG: hypothetical protein ACK4TN_03655, partial [Brevinematales bacterium]
MKGLWKISGIFLLSGLYGLFLGGKGCLFFPEAGLPSLEFSLSQDIRLPYGFFVEGNIIYYRLFGIGVEGGNTVWGIFSGDIIGTFISPGWQYQQRQWQSSLFLHGGWGYIFDMELREQIAREYIHTLEGSEPLVVSTKTKDGHLFGWGISTDVHYQWKRVSLGIFAGWMDLQGNHSLTLQWSELFAGTLYQREKIWE